MIKKNAFIPFSESRKLFFICMTAFITTGIITGSCFAVCGNDMLKNSPVFNQYISPLFNGSSLFEIIKNTFLSVSAVIMIIFCTGFFAVGQPVAILSLIYRGFGIGVSTALTYMAFGKDGFYLTLIFIVPKILATSVIIMLAVREALRLSNIIYSFIFRDSARELMGRYIRLYCLKFIILIFLSLITAAADSGINYLFGYML